MARDQDTIKTTFSGSDITVVAYPSYDILKKKSIGLEAAKNRRDIAATRQRQAQSLSRETNLKLIRARPLAETGSEPFITADGMRNLNSRQAFLSGLPDSAQANIELEAMSSAQAESEQRLNEIKDDFFFELGSIATISYSMFREKFAVRSLGTTSAKSYTRGPRTIAGTMIFTVFNDFEFDRMLQYFKKNYAIEARLLDQLPSFNLMLVFSNEYGSTSILNMFDLEFNSEGQSQSIDDLTINKSLNFYARDLIPMRPVLHKFTSYSDMFSDTVSGQTEKTGYFENFEEPILTYDQIVNRVTDPSVQELINKNRRTTI